MPIYINSAADQFETRDGRITPTMGSFNVNFDGSSGDPTDTDGRINRALDQFTASFGDRTWPANSWFMTGGYQISNAGDQLVNEPALTYNAEKDILIPQMFGAFEAQCNTFAGYYKNVKDYNPNCKIIAYSSTLVVIRVRGSGVGWPDFNYDIINGTTGSPNWYLVDKDNNRVQSAFRADSQRVNCYANQFNISINGLNFPRAFLSEFFKNASTDGGNGRLLDVIDGIFMDVVDPAPQEVYVDATPPATGGDRVETNRDFNRNGVADQRNDETIPADPANEGGYGGARMLRRGAVKWVNDFENIFGPNQVLFRNGVRDGLDYSPPYGILRNGDPIDQSEYYKAWGGGIFETVQLGLGIRRNSSASSYDIAFNGVGETCRHLARIKSSLIDNHQWGKFGSHAIVVEAWLLDRAPTTADYNMARFLNGLIRLNGACSGLSKGKLQPFPTMDEDVFAIGDTIDGNPPVMGTFDPSVSSGGANNDYTLRSPDYEIGSADFYWQQYNSADGTEKYIWVVRTDFSGGNTHGYGTAVACQLPPPGSGKKWVHVDVRSTVTNGIRFTRAQDTALNNGSDIDAGIDPWGQVDLKPAHAVLLVSADS